MASAALKAGLLVHSPGHAARTRASYDALEEQGCQCSAGDGPREGQAAFVVVLPARDECDGQQRYGHIDTDRARGPDDAQCCARLRNVMRAQRLADGVVDGLVLIDAQTGNERCQQRDTAAGDGGECQGVSARWCLTVSE